MRTQNPALARSGPRMVDETGVWFGITTAILIGTFLTCAAFHLDATETALAAIIVGGLVAARLPGLLAGVVGLVGWAMYTGFAENSFGQLTFSGADLARLAGFGAATVVIAYGVRQAVFSAELQTLSSRRPEDGRHG